MKVLLTGVSGYVGSCLLPLLLRCDDVERVFALSRRSLTAIGHKKLTVLVGDAADAECVRDAVVARSPEIVFYLIHCMGDENAEFDSVEHRIARNFASCLAPSQTLVYLGGLVEPQCARLSRHMRARQETGDVLRSGAARVVELRASVIVGSGSLSFDLVQLAADNMPYVIPCTRLMRVQAQPVSIAHVTRALLQYATDADVAPTRHVIVNLGGREVVNYCELMLIYARVRGLRRWPLWLSGDSPPAKGTKRATASMINTIMQAILNFFVYYFLLLLLRDRKMVTIARRLMPSLRHATIVHEVGEYSVPDDVTVINDVGEYDCQDAIRQALDGN